MPHLIQIINARLVDGNNLTTNPLWFNPEKGVFVSPPNPTPPSTSANIIDLQNRIVSPGFIDLQINGAYGFDFSEDIADNVQGYLDRYGGVRRKLVTTGTTSFLPTMTSQFPERYHQNLPHLGPSQSRDPIQGSESLGAHCEGPFFAHNRMGVHFPDAIRASGSTSSPDDVSSTYGRDNLVNEHESCTSPRKPGTIPSNIRMITLAPERPGALETTRWLSREGIVMSIGHMAADYRQSQAGIGAGARMMTHLFNQMNGHHHREPGPLGVLGGVEERQRVWGERLDSRPFFGIICDGNHVHPGSVRLANLLHPEGLVLVTDALLMLGGEDGTIDWLTRRLVKEGISVKLEGTDIIAGSCVTLLQCLNNFRRWTGLSIPAALRAVTSRPAEVLGLGEVKGTLGAGADADFVVLSEEVVPGESTSELVVDQVWKFGVKVYDRRDDGHT